MTRITTESQSPLELFLRDYVAAREGMWDEIEPQVYDVLLGAEMMQVAFDPEALQEHPAAQLATLGSPLFDRLLCDAATRWNSAEFYRIGLHLAPRQLDERIRRSIALPAGATAQIQRVRAMNCPQAIFWFKATFASDQKEDEVLPVGIDLCQLREVRKLDVLLAFDRLSEEPEWRLCEAPHQSLAAGYTTARAHAARSFASLANARRREWSGAVEKQIARMRGYYAQLRQESAATSVRTTDPAAAAARAQSRQDAIVREERLRITELQRKSELRVGVKLTSLLIVQQPKLMIWLAVAVKARPMQVLPLVWNPLSDSIEAAACPSCGQPTFALEMDRHRLRCPRCPAK